LYILYIYFFSFNKEKGPSFDEPYIMKKKYFNFKNYFLNHFVLEYNLYVCYVYYYIGTTLHKVKAIIKV